MIVAETRTALREAVQSAVSDDVRVQATVALVPTMGALHEGHAALLDEGRGRADLLVASIFVNPLQFGPNEDLARYPRTFDTDLQVCASHGVDVVFAPSVEEVYPGGDPLVTIEPGPLADTLDGASRPGHFRGVLTVVAKLFGLVQPEVALFGEKDYQQLALITEMTRDLCMPIEVVGVPTVRDADGLALSSRNAYLSPGQRGTALALSQALRAGQANAAAGPDAVLKSARAVLAAEPDIDLDYLELRGPALETAPRSGRARLLVAAKVGSTRLIDNIGLDLG